MARQDKVERDEKRGGVAFLLCIFPAVRVLLERLEIGSGSRAKIFRHHGTAYIHSRSTMYMLSYMEARPITSQPPWRLVRAAQALFAVFCSRKTPVVTTLLIPIWLSTLSVRPSQIAILLNRPASSPVMSGLLGVFKSKWITPPKAVKEDYSGKTVIVTGATSGIGKEAVHQFAALGAAKVIVAARDVRKGAKLKAHLTSRLGRGDQLEVWQLDMMDYSSVKAFAKRAEQLDHLDIVVLNAGVRRKPYVLSPYGWEEDLQVNTLSTTLLAILLLPKLKASKQITGRIPVLEFVNSGLHQKAVLPRAAQEELSVLQYYNKRENFHEGSQYSFSKLFLMHTTNQLADEIGSEDVIITSICPGWVNTHLGRDHFFPGVFLLAWLFILLFMRTPSQGANTILSALALGERVHGRFYQHDQIQPVAPSLAGSEMRTLAMRIWVEVVEALGRDVPELDVALGAAVSGSGKLH